MKISSVPFSLLSKNKNSLPHQNIEFVFTITKSIFNGNNVEIEKNLSPYLKKYQLEDKIYFFLIDSLKYLMKNFKKINQKEYNIIYLIGMILFLLFTRYNQSCETDILSLSKFSVDDIHSIFQTFLFFVENKKSDLISENDICMDINNFFVSILKNDNNIFSTYQTLQTLLSSTNINFEEKVIEQYCQKILKTCSYIYTKRNSTCEKKIDISLLKKQIIILLLYKESYSKYKDIFDVFINKIFELINKDIFDLPFEEVFSILTTNNKEDYLAERMKFKINQSYDHSTQKLQQSLSNSYTLNKIMFNNKHLSEKNIAEMIKAYDEQGLLIYKESLHKFNEIFYTFFKAIIKDIEIVEDKISDFF